MITTQEIVAEYGAYLRRSEDSSKRFALEVFIEDNSGVVPRSVLKRTLHGLCLEAVEEFVWEGLLSLRDY